MTGNAAQDAALEALAQRSQRAFLERPIRLGHLAISPDGRFLAASENSRPFHGLLIPLGTVHRLTLDPSAIPESLPEVVVRGDGGEQAPS